MSDKNLKVDPKKLDELYTMASRLLAYNSSYGSGRFRQDISGFLSGGYDGADALHNVFIDYGYPFNLSFNNFWNMYRRFGIATNVINLPVDMCFITLPVIKFGGEENSRVESFFERIKFWSRIKGLDKRQRVGRYGGLFVRVRDGKMPEEPLEPGSLNGESSVMEIIPLYESQLEIIESDTDTQSESYGKPIMIQYSQGALGSRNEEVRNTINIHASRVIFAAEGADDGSIYQIPILEPIYNSLLDLRKIIGGSAEGFYRNASQATVFDLKDPSQAQIYKKELDEFNENFDDFIQNRMRKGLWTPGMEAKTLESHLVSSDPHFNAALNDVAAGSKIAATILIGKQTGRLASTEDSRHFLSTCQSRRINWLTPCISNVIDWFMANNIFANVDFEVVWDDLLALSKEEKLKNSTSMSKINETQYRSGGDTVFESDEIREAAGYDPMDIITPDGETDIDTDID